MRPGMPFDMSKFRSNMRALGFIDTVTGMAMPWEVPCVGFTREALGDEAFELEHRRRRLWCEMECPQAHYIHGLHDDRGKLIGRVFRFQNPDNAVWFRLRFC
jgi:hypothetical protein